MEVRRELFRLRRRVRAALFLQGAGQAVLVLALAAAAALLTLRFVGVYLEPARWWLAALALPPAWGGYRAVRDGLGDRRGALHLDRRWQLGGLLITSMETDAAAWEPTLRERLVAAERALPAPRMRPFFVRMVPPALILAVVLLLPPPPVRASTHNLLVEEALAKLEAELEIALEEGRLDEEKKRELSTRIRELRDDTQQAEWSDVDALADRLAHEDELAKSRAERTRAALAELAQRARSGGDAGERLLQEAGGEELLARLPEDLARKLAGGELGSLTPEQLERLAGALQDAAMEGALAKRGEFMDPAELEDLRRLVECEQGENGTPCGACQGKGCKECEGTGWCDGTTPGKGGISRGRGDAALQNTNDTQGDTDPFQARKLPRGRTISREWELIGVTQATPDANPVRDRSAGRAGAQGSGAASWHRRLAPRHREVVRKFFTERSSK